MKLSRIAVLKVAGPGLVVLRYSVDGGESVKVMWAQAKMRRRGECILTGGSLKRGDVHWRPAGQREDIWIGFEPMKSLVRMAQATA